MPLNRLIILGASVTALAVVRNARSNHLNPVVVDTHDGVAFHSSYARAVVCAGKTDGQILEILLEEGRPHGGALIATSDRWIDFLVSHRASLEQAYDLILQASNEVLAICTDKLLFARWCDEHGVPAPRLHRLDKDGDESGVAASDFPLLVRPYKGVMNAAARGLPKAVEVADAAALRACLARFCEAGVQPIVTQSLLGRELVQYSVGLARSGDRMTSFVAEKRRPLARQCAVGSYVVMCENPEVERLAREVAERIDYFGIAEFEILQARDSGEIYLIEINARPWIQYELGTRSGHDLLGVLLGTLPEDAAPLSKTGVQWLDFDDDLFNCFSRSVGVVRSGELSVPAYLASLWRANAFARWRFGDQGPFWRTLGRSVKTIISRRLG